MKQVQNKLYLGLAMLGLLVPLQVNAAGQDSVELSQEGSKVAVSLEMSNAPQEKITTVAVSLEVKADGQEKVTVDFQFSAQLSGTEHGYVYNEDTGRQDIYVASATSLFSEETLNLGSVQLQPVDASKTVSANISYCQNSFQTANSSYGDKTPMVEGETASVDIKVGNGVNDSTSSGGNTAGSGSNNGGALGSDSAGNTTGGSQGSSNSSSDNRNQGLYDDTTRFVNDPAASQLLASSIIKGTKPGAGLIDMSAAAGLTGTGNRGTGNIGVKPGNGIFQTKENGKVSVVSPENGPASILVSGENSGNNGEGSLGGLFAGILGDDYIEGGEDVYSEILLDQENGGAVDNRKNVKRNLIIAAGIALAVIIVTGGIFFLVKSFSMPAAGRKKKRRKKKRKVKRKPGRRRRR